MSILDKDLGDEQEHAFLEVEGPDVNSTCVLDLIVEGLLRLEYSE
jgi:hypothetical protein